MIHRMQQKILFKHCDPAGIVFYPRYFEMMNDCVENLFEDVLDLPFSSMHPERGVPTAQISTNFHAPSRLGDRLEILLTILKLGRTSMSLHFQAKCKGALRFETTSTLVFVSETGRPTPWPDSIRDKCNNISTKDNKDEP